MKRIYLDTCVVIYVVEKHHAFSAQIENRMKNLSQVEFMVSPLTEMEKTPNEERQRPVYSNNYRVATASRSS